MNPLLFDGDITYITKCCFSSIKENDIIAFKRHGIVIHRVLYKTRNYLITKGDNAGFADPRVYPRNVIGKVNRVKRGDRIIDINLLYFIQSSLYLNEIQKVTRLFHINNIQYVILKGLPLHMFYENSHPKRLYLDCDFLISAKDRPKAEKILLARKYRKMDVSLTPVQKKFSDDLPEHSYMKIVEGFPIVFDIHTEIVFGMTQLGNLNELYPHLKICSLTQSMIKHRRLIKFDSLPIPALSQEDLILYLCLHFFHHNFQGIYRLFFLHTVICRSKNVDWQTLALQIRNYELNNYCYPVFVLLKKYYKTGVPEKFADDIIPGPNAIKYLKTLLAKVDIFGEDKREKAGIRRFMIFFTLSPEPLLRKLLIIFNPFFLSAFLWSLKRRVFSNALIR